MKEITEEQAREALRVLRILSLDGSENGTSDLYERGISLNCLSTLITRYFQMEKALKEIVTLPDSPNRSIGDYAKIAQQALTGKGEGE